MKPYLLEKREGDKYEQIQFFDEFYTHYTEEPGSTGTRTKTYDKAGTTREECIIAYQEEGYGEARNGD